MTRIHQQGNDANPCEKRKKSQCTELSDDINFLTDNGKTHCPEIFDVIYSEKKTNELFL